MQNKLIKQYKKHLFHLIDIKAIVVYFRVCPYYMARELKTTADIIFMPYNYLLDLKVCLKIFDCADSFTVEENVLPDMLSTGLLSSQEKQIMWIFLAA